jgi:hypothetical protein
MQTPNLKTQYDRALRLELPHAQANRLLGALPPRQRQDRARYVTRQIKNARASRIQAQGHYGSTKRDARMAARVAKSYRARQKAAKGSRRGVLV